MQIESDLLTHPITRMKKAGGEVGWGVTTHQYLSQGNLSLTSGNAEVELRTLPRMAYTYFVDDKTNLLIQLAHVLMCT